MTPPAAPPPLRRIDCGRLLDGTGGSLDHASLVLEGHRRGACR
jgi:hypothetical protein